MGSTLKSSAYLVILLQTAFMNITSETTNRLGDTSAGVNIDVRRKEALQSGNAAFHKFAQRIY